MLHNHLPTIAIKRIVCVLLMLTADSLFYDQPVGWTAGLYAGLLGLMLMLFNRNLLQTIAGKVVIFCTVTLIIALFESPDLRTISLTGIGMMTLLILQKRKKLSCAVLWLKDITSFLSQGVWQWYKDLKNIKRITPAKARDKVNLNYAIIPVSLTLLFGMLFAQANPIIAKALGDINWQLLSRFISLWRWLFWFSTGVVVWALLRPRFRLAADHVPGASINLDRWLNRQTIVLSLVLFNSLFALQNSLDIAFLWSGEALPDGVNYAQYAQAGAYPLLFICLLTAAYVLITFGDHRQHYQTDTAKKLTFVWLGQNIFLLMSAINRLLHYIEVYSLTYLRITALIGMALTAVGLLLIITRIYANHRNSWLVNANALVIAVTLYGTCFINMDRMIADYNVRHALEITGKGSSVDLVYMRSLGSESLPALRWFQANAKYSPHQTIRANLLIAELESQASASDSNWRAWTWRKHRQTEFKSAPVQAVPIDQSGWQY
ncbi:MAG: DUF4173 domain-containing protein [Methylococcaceae bacterium]